MKNKFLLLFVTTFFLWLNNIYSQSGTFNFYTGTTQDGTIITQTVSGVKLTVYSDKSLHNPPSDAPSVTLQDWSAYPPFSNNTATMNGIEKPSCTLEFDHTVNIASLMVSDFDGVTVYDLLFTPNTGSSMHQTGIGATGTTVTLNFIGVTSIVITNNAGGNIDIGLDDVVMDASLPVELTSFTALTNNNSVTLNWATTTEINNYGFEIHRSVISGQSPVGYNGQQTTDNWQSIGFVHGYGNSNSPKSYSFTDNSPLGSNVQYRLKQIDFDGGYKYYGPVEATINVAKFVLNQNYPNPFNPVTHISYSLPEKALVNLTVYDALGRRVANLVNKEQESGVYNVELNGSNLNSGIYFYELKAGRYSEVKKLLLVK